MNDLKKKLYQIEQDKRRILSNYQKERYLELLKRSEELESFSMDESEEACELFYYSYLLYGQLNWETRDYFLQLQEKFLENKIDIGDFCDAFCERELLNGEAADMLEPNFILLTPHKKSLDFSILTKEILEACYSYDPDAAESSEIWERDRKEFRDFVQRIYLQMQNLLKE